MSTVHPSAEAGNRTIIIESANQSIGELVSVAAGLINKRTDLSTNQLIVNHWLVKSEPDAYGWHHFTDEGRAVWNGVRNYQARNNLNAMKMGDQVLFYHSVTNPAVVGLAMVVGEAYPDPTVSDLPNRWVVVELEPVLALDKPVSLCQIKADPLLANIGLIKQSRLSVMPIRPDEFELILRMGLLA